MQLANLAEAAASGGAVPAVLQALAQRDQERRRLADELGRLDVGPIRNDRAEVLPTQMRALLGDWDALLKRDMAKGPADPRSRAGGADNLPRGAVCARSRPLPAHGPDRVRSRIQYGDSGVFAFTGSNGVPNLGVTSGYQKAANEARTTTRFWQGMAVLSMLGTIAFALKAFLPAIQGSFSWPSFAGRVVLTLAVGVLAGYSATQGDRYLEIERRNRKLALELEAIGPYLSPLPADKQEMFRLQIGERTFGRDESGFGRSSHSKSPATLKICY